MSNLDPESTSAQMMDMLEIVHDQIRNETIPVDERMLEKLELMNHTCRMKLYKIKIKEEEKERLSIESKIKPFMEKFIKDKTITSYKLNIPKTIVVEVWNLDSIDNNVLYIIELSLRMVIPNITVLAKEKPLDKINLNLNSSEMAHNTQEFLNSVAVHKRHPLRTLLKYLRRRGNILDYGFKASGSAVYVMLKNDQQNQIIAKKAIDDSMIRMKIKNDSIEYTIKGPVNSLENNKLYDSSDDETEGLVKMRNKVVETAALGSSKPNYYVFPVGLRKHVLDINSTYEEAFLAKTPEEMPCRLTTSFFGRGDYLRSVLDLPTTSHEKAELKSALRLSAKLPETEKVIDENIELETAIALSLSLDDKQSEEDEKKE